MPPIILLRKILSNNINTNRWLLRWAWGSEELRGVRLEIQELFRLNEDMLDYCNDFYGPEADRMIGLDRHESIGDYEQAPICNCASQGEPNAD